jgi:phosphate-selective porin OprO/OprP
VAENVGYMIEFDFAVLGRPSFMDVYLDLQELPVGTLRVGQWRQPFGMDAMTSVRELWFLERALPFAFVPFRQTGIGIFDTALDESMTWAVSAYRYPTDPFGNDFGDSGYGGSTRVTAAPYYDEELNAVVHLGAGYSINNPSTGRVRFRSTPEVFFTLGDFNTPPTAVRFFIDTGPIPASLYNLVGAELGGALGPFTVQSEVFYAMVDQRAGPALQFPGAYVQAAWVLTGEHHPYNRQTGVFTRVVPDAPFGTTGCGAWEVLARWSKLDLSDENVAGGRLHDVTLGLNWYLNRFTKFQLNYVHAILDSTASDHAVTDVAAVRAQVDF